VTTYVGPIPGQPQTSLLVRLISAHLKELGLATYQVSKHVSVGFLKMLQSYIIFRELGKMKNIIRLYVAISPSGGGAGKTATAAATGTAACRWWGWGWSSTDPQPSSSSSLILVSSGFIVGFVARLPIIVVGLVS